MVERCRGFKAEALYCGILRQQSGIEFFDRPGSAGFI